MAGADKQPARRLAQVVAVLRHGVLEAVAHRASVIVWVATTSFPLISLVMWLSVAQDGPVGNYDADRFVSYFIVTFLVRQATASWVVWELESSIRDGRLALAVLRPFPALAYVSLMNVAALPLRLLFASPVALGAWVFADHLKVSTDWLTWVATPLILALAWLIVLFGQICIACGAFWWTKSSSLYEIWIALYVVGSGYMVPLDLMPADLAAVARALPFHAAMGLVVELMVGTHGREQIPSIVAIQLAWVLALGILAAFLWRRGMRRFSAVGA